VHIDELNRLGKIRENWHFEPDPARALIQSFNGLEIVYRDDWVIVMACSGQESETTNPPGSQSP
jgi:hypothetical protein